MHESVPGLVLRQKPYREQDRLLTILTAGRGLLTAYAPRVHSRRGAPAAATEVLSYSNFTLFENRGNRYVTGAEPIALFFGVRERLDALSLAVYFCQLALELLSEGTPAGEELRLLLNSLSFLERGRMPLPQLKALFELRLLTLAGFMPDLVGCRLCGSLGARPVWLDPAAGTLVCSACRTGAEGRLLPLTDGVLNAMRHILYSDFSRLFSFRTGPAAAGDLAAVSEAYLVAQVEKILPALSYYHRQTGR